MQKIDVKLDWSGKNYGGGWGNPVLGIILSTGDTWEEFTKDFEEALDFHIEGMMEHGDQLPQWAVERDYEIEYRMTVSASGIEVHHLGGNKSCKWIEAFRSQKVCYGCCLPQRCSV